MIIGLVSREYPPFFGGGVGTYVYQVSRALAAAGHEVHVFTVRTDEDKSFTDPPGVQVHRVDFAPPEGEQTRLIGPWTLANRWFYTAAIFREQLLSFIEDNRLDIVEFPEWEAPGWMLLQDWRWNVPSVVNCHTPTWVLQDINRQPSLAGQHMEKLELALADGVCAPCTPMAERVEAGVETERPVTVVHHPFFADEVADVYEPPTGKRIVYVGRLEFRKGVVDLIEAAHLVLAKHPDAEFFLVGGDTPTAPGGGSMKDYLLPRIDDGVRDRIHFVQNIPPEKLYAYYRSALFCTFPSIFENFPNVCLEAMAAGRTAVVGNDSGMVEMIADAGIHLPPQQPETLAKTMIELLDDPERAAELGRQAFTRVREVFLPAAQAEARVEFYQSVLDITGASIELSQRLARVKATVWRQVAPELADGMRLLLTGKIDTADFDNPAVERIIRRVRMKLGHTKPSVRIALYGAGQHTQKLVPYFPALAEKGISVVLILDDNPARAGSELGGVPIAPATEALKAAIDCVVLSSDAMEHKLWEKSLPLRNAGLTLLRLYANN